MTVASTKPKPLPWSRRLRTIGRFTYVGVLQTLVGVVWLLLAAYLAVNAPSSGAVVGNLVSGLIPGQMRIGGLRFGPVVEQGELRLRLRANRVELLEPEGDVVLTAERLRAQIAPWQLADGLRRGALNVHLPRVELVRPVVRLDHDRHGRLRLPQVFASADEPPPPIDEQKPIQLRIGQLLLRDGTLVVDLPAIRIHSQALSCEVQGFHFSQQPGGDPDVRYELQQVRSAQTEVRVAAMAQMPPVPAASLQVESVLGDLKQVKVSGLSVQMPPLRATDPLASPDTTLSHARLNVQMGEATAVDGDRVTLVTSSASPFMRVLLGDLFDAHARVVGRFRVSPTEGFETEGSMLGGGLVAGFQTNKVAAQVRVEAQPRGEAGVRVTARDVEAVAYDGRLTAPRIDYRMAAERPEHLVRGQFTFEGMRGEGPLSDRAVGLRGLVPQLATGRLSGTLGTSVRVHLPIGQPMDMDTSLDGDLVLLRDTAVTMLEQPLPRVHWQGGMDVSMGPSQGLQVKFRDANLATATAHEGGDSLGDLHADGTLDLSGDRTDLKLALEVPRLQDWLEPLGMANVRGALSLRDTALQGKYLTPGLVGKLEVQDLQAAGQTIAHAHANVRLGRGALFLDHLTAKTSVGDVRAEVELGLFGQDLTTLSPQRMVRVRQFSVSHLDLGRLAATYHAGDIKGVGELHNGSLSCSLNDPMGSMQLRTHVALRDVRAAGEQLETADATVSMAAGVVTLADAVMRRRGAKQDGSDDLHVAGNYDLRRRRIDAEMTMPLQKLQSFSALKDLPVAGSLGLTAKLRGDPRGLELHADATVEGLQWGTIKLGDARLNVTKPRDGKAVLSSPQFFDRYRLLDGSEFAFQGWALRSGHLRLGTAGSIDPFAALGLERPVGTSVRLDGAVDVALDLRPGHALWQVDAVLPSGGLQVDVGGGLPALRNTQPAHVLLSPSGLHLDSLWLDVGRHGMELCGDMAFDPAGGPPLLNGFVAGTIDVPRVGVLSQTLADLDLRLDILADTVVAADPKARCLSSLTNGGGALRLEGPLDKLRVQGLVQTRSGRVSMRRFGHDIVIGAGGRLQIATTQRGAMAVTIPTGHELRGQIDDGRFIFGGRMTLQDLHPQTAELTLRASDIPFAVAKEYQMLLSTDVKFNGTQLGDPARRDMRLEGNAFVGEGSFYRSFDRLSGVVGNASERSVSAYSKPLTETMPWLSEVRLNLAVRGSNFEVASRFPLGKTDLVTEFNLRVSGTLGNLRVNDRLRVMDGSGSQISYSVNNLVFEVERGTLDFAGEALKPYLDLNLRTEIPVRGSTRSGATATNLGSDLTTDASQLDEIVQVFVHISGVFSEQSKEFDVQLSSNKGDTEADIQCLIVTRRRCNDQSGGSNPRITTDFLFGEALNAAVTGLFKTLVDTVQIDFDPVNLGVAAEMTKKLGKTVALGAQVQTGRENRYNANFAFRITERLSLNGLWRRQRLLDTTGTQDASVDVYESKLRYKVPLPDQ